MANCSICQSKVLTGIIVALNQIKNNSNILNQTKRDLDIKMIVCLKMNL